MNNYEKIIELTFKVVVILASLGVVGALFKSAYTQIKKGLLYFANVEQRITALENKLNRRKKKKPLKK